MDIFCMSANGVLSNLFTADTNIKVAAINNNTQLSIKHASGKLPAITNIQIFPMYTAAYTATPFSKAHLATSAPGKVVFLETPGAGTTSTQVKFPTPATLPEIRIRGMAGANTLNGIVGGANAGKSLDKNGAVPPGGSTPANVKITITTA
jgi:hypothetical protein